MISSIGKKFSLKSAKPLRDGFTLLEILATVGVLATGIVMVYKAFLVSMDYQEYLTHRLYAMNLLDHMVAVIQNDYQTEDQMSSQPKGEIGEVTLNNRPMAFRLETEIRSIEGLENISELDANISWPEQGKTLRLSKAVYLFRW
jgi:prepilin-type N-terminal cleavage/methylation domain-containing protein